MSYEEIVPKVDSIQMVHKELSFMHDVLNEEGILSFESHDYLSYISQDTIHIIYLTKNRKASSEIMYRMNGGKIAELNTQRELLNEEREILARQLRIMARFDVYSKNTDIDKHYKKIYLHDSRGSKVFVFSSPRSDEVFSFRDSFVLSETTSGSTFERAYNVGGNDIKIIRSSGDTLDGFGINSVKDDFYFSNIHLLLFKYYTPEWWLNEFELYSNRNKRRFIYNKHKDEVEIVKRSYE